MGLGGWDCRVGDVRCVLAPSSKFLVARSSVASFLGERSSVIERRLVPQ